MNIYSGKDINREKEWTLGESVVRELSKNIEDYYNMPKFQNKKRNRGDADFVCNQYGTSAMSWKDTKDVLVISNCHGKDMTTVTRTGKDGSKKDVACPQSIYFYNKFMGGVDLSDQLVSLYDMDIKSQKWRKGVFYRLFMISCVNSWIAHNELHN